MLKSFTWPEFLLASIILSLVWWAGVWLLCYRGRGVKAARLRRDWDEELEELPDVMGKVASEPGVSVVEAEAFSFAEGERLDSDKVSRLGDISDVQQEIREVCKLLSAEDGTKEDFFTLFEMVRSKYPKVGLDSDAGSLAGLNDFIREHVPFALSEEELESLWV